MTERIQQKSRLPVNRTTRYSPQQVPDQTYSLVSGKQHGHLSGFNRLGVQARQCSLRRLAANLLLARQTISDTVDGIPVITLHTLLRPYDQHRSRTMPRAHRATDEAMTVAIHPTALLRTHLRAIGGQARIDFERRSLQRQRLIDSGIGTDIPGMKKVQIRYLLRHQVSICQTGTGIFRSVARNNQCRFYCFANSFVGGVRGAYRPLALTGI